MAAGTELIPPRAAEIIARLGLVPHPEGGRYRRVFGSSEAVRRLSDDRERPGLSCIYYLLLAGEEGAWHRVRSDEAWSHCEGAALRLAIADAEGHAAQEFTVGPLGEGAEPLRVVPAGHWQRARSLGAYSLVSCAVGPGFDFADFTLLEQLPPGEDGLRRRLAALAWR